MNLAIYATVVHSSPLTLNRSAFSLIKALSAGKQFLFVPKLQRKNSLTIQTVDDYAVECSTLSLIDFQAQLLRKAVADKYQNTQVFSYSEACLISITCMSSPH